MRVTYFQRRPGKGHYSIEGAFEVMVAHLGPDVTARTHIARFRSEGLWRRVCNLLEAPWFQGDVNHITGDIHYVALLLRRTRTVLTIHDLDRYRALTGLRRRLYRLMWITLPIRRSRIVTVPSEATRADVIAASGCPPEKVRVLPIPVSPRFAHSPRPFPPARPTILAIGSAPNKNLDRLIEAVADIDCHLELVGTPTPSQYQRLRQLGISCAHSAELDSDQILAKYREADLVSFVSTREGFGLPIAEAQAVGRPVVTSNCSSLPEVAGSAARLVDPFDPEDIRRGLLQVIGDTGYRERLVAAGLENVRRFAPRPLAARFRSLYEEILAEPQHGTVAQPPRPVADDSSC